MTTIGLIGEDPNDTTSIKNLLLQKHPDLVFKQLLKSERGDGLKNSRLSKALNIEFKRTQPQFVLFIRDADVLPSENDKIEKVEEWFKKLNSVINGKGILLTNIYELEALILADISTFNKVYKTKISVTKNVMYQKDPKEFLIEKTRKTQKQYKVSDCPELFGKLKIDVVLANCTYLKEFYLSFKNSIGL